MIAKVGPIPPPSGPARSEFLLRRGTRSAQLAIELFEQSQAAVGEFLVLDELPYRRELLAEPDPVDAEERAKAWEACRGSLVFGVMARSSIRIEQKLLRPEPRLDLPGERLARQALQEAVGAFRDLRGTEVEVASHWNLHRLGEHVAGLYGCFLNWDETEQVWFDCCLVERAHNPFGMSPGFTSKRLCSICRQDIAECSHESGGTYRIDAERYDDDGLLKCSVCHQTECSHTVGEGYEVSPSSIMVDMKLHETSLTRNPREPRALITEVEMDPQPPRRRSEHDRVRCRRCLLPCSESLEPQFN